MSYRWSLVFGVACYLWGCMAFAVEPRPVSSTVLRIAAASTGVESGVIPDLIEGFKATRPGIEIQLDVVGALEALNYGRTGKTDLVITHHPPEEERFVEQGYGLLHTQIIFSEYALFGPSEDPLKLAKISDLSEVLKAMAINKVSFMAPHPRSGTSRKVQELWSIAGVDPNWTGYENTGLSGIATLQMASDFGGYTIADIGTYYANRDSLGRSLAILHRGDRALRNVYSAMVVSGKKVAGVNQELATEFLQYLVSDGAQDGIAKFGERKYNATFLSPAAHLDPEHRARVADQRMAQEKTQANQMRMLAIGLFVLLVMTILLALLVRRAERNTHRAQQQQNLIAKARDEAVEAGLMKSSFLANMSHEIRTPLTTVIGYAESMLEKDQTMPQRVHAIQTIVRSGRHLVDLINDILDLSKTEAGKLLIEPVPMNLPELISNVMDMGNQLAAKKHVSLTLNYVFPVPAIVVADPVRLRQVLLNLVSNAIKFSAHGTVNLEVALDLKNKQMIFKVRDNGIGISSEQMDRLFQPFEQADISISHRFGGTGLGLALSRSLAEQMGGKLTAESQVDKGSCFTLFLPIGAVSEDALIDDVDHLIPQATESLTHAPGRQLHGRVLLAEDNIDNQRLFMIILRGFGLSVDVASDGKVAMEAALAGDFDVVLMDMQMPVIDGIAATRALREKGYAKPIIALTANAMAEDRLRCEEAGYTGFLSKPIEREALFNKLAEYISTVEVHHSTEEPLVSELRDSSPAMSDLIKEYVQRLPKYRESIVELLQAHDWVRLKPVMHDLKGTGGAFGFPVLTELAAKIEFQLACQNYSAVEELIEELFSICGRIQMGYSTVDSSAKL